MPRRLIQARSGDCPVSHDPAFVQQGEVDWVSLSKSIVSMSVGTLSRLSGAGVQEMTYVSALQLGTRFRLPDIGYRRVEEAIAKTSYAPAIANVAYFGFGHRSFIHLLADFRSGVNFIALCGALQEAHGEDLAARVLSSLWANMGWPEEYQPSNAQFRCLVKACSGVFARTGFPETVGVMLGPLRRFQQARLSPTASDPAETAAVLEGLFDISQGIRTRIDVVGGAECAFVAAVAYWLFDFRIHVDDEQGQTLFTSSSTANDQQVYIICESLAHVKSAAISKSTYVLNDPKEILRYLPDESLRWIRSRVPWTRCLRRTFGNELNDLLDLSSSFGKIIGGLARINQARAHGERHFWPMGLHVFVEFPESARGRGLIDTMQHHLPELDDVALVEAATEAAQCSTQKAYSGIEDALALLRRCCKCSLCDDRRHHHTLICLRALATTLVRLVLNLASIDYTPELSPTEAGLYALYDTVKLSMGSVKDEPAVKEFARAIDPSMTHDGGSCITSSSTSVTICPAYLMAGVIRLFTGYGMSTAEKGISNYRTAVAQDGICVYMGCLESAVARPELLRMIHVLPGQICKGQAIYDSIWDCADTQPPSLESMTIKPVIEGHNLESRVGPTCNIELTAFIDEPSKAGQLTLYYRLTTPQGQVFVQPGRITCRILERAGLITCSKENCDKRLATMAYYVLSGWTMNEDTWIEIVEAFQCTNTVALIWQHAYVDDNAHLLALQLQGGRHSFNRDIAVLTFVRQGECIPCCIRAAKRSRGMWADKALVHIL